MPVKESTVKSSHSWTAFNSTKLSNFKLSNIMRQVLVIGSTSFLGSRIALCLHDIGYNVTLRDDLISLPLEPMAWYRYDKLVERNLIPRYEDFTAETLVRSLLTKHNQGTVIYVPSLLFDGKHEDNYSYDYLKS